MDAQHFVRNRAKRPRQRSQTTPSADRPQRTKAGNEFRSAPGNRRPARPAPRAPPSPRSACRHGRGTQQPPSSPHRPCASRSPALPGPPPGKNPWDRAARAPNRFCPADRGRRRRAESRPPGLRRACAAACPRCRETPRPQCPCRSAFNCARRRWLLVPTARPGGSSARLAYFTETNTSRGSTRAGVAASAKAAGSSVGRSLSECTAKIDAARGQRLFDLLGEHSLASRPRRTSLPAGGRPWS